MQNSVDESIIISMSELNLLTAARAAREIAAGKITSEALARDCLERIAQRDGQVQAWVHLDPEAALAQARAIDKAGRQRRARRRAGRRSRT